MSHGKKSSKIFFLIILSSQVTMEMILKNGLEWSQIQMKRYKGKRIAGQEIPILTNTRAQEMLDRIPFWPTERQMLDKTWCKMLDTMTFCSESIRPYNRNQDMPRLNGYISLLDNMDQLTIGFFVIMKFKYF